MDVNGSMSLDSCDLFQRERPYTDLRTHIFVWPYNQLQNQSRNKEREPLVTTCRLSHFLHYQGVGSLNALGIYRRHKPFFPRPYPTFSQAWSNH
jgi:hypothetical protein